MPPSLQRTPRACERCRKTRRKCRPPYPCQQCVAAGEACQVRKKARPRRRQQHSGPASSIEIDVPSVKDQRTANGVSSFTPTGDGETCVLEEGPRSDTYTLVKALVQDVLFARHGYVLDCGLAEPRSCKTDAQYGLTAPMTQQQSITSPQLSNERVWDLLTKFQQFTNWEDAKLVDLDELQAIARAHSKCLEELSPSSLVATGKAHHLLDSFALLFAAIALGAVAAGSLDHGKFYSRISTEVLKHFEGHATLEPCLAYFLQHVFALRSGTSSDVQSILASAIEVAHGIRLQHKAHGIRGLQLYLLIYMADQYCSLTHCTGPIVRQANLPDQLFTPLKDAKPQLQTLIDLVTINGFLIEQSHCHEDLSKDGITALEAKISKLCSREAICAPTREAAESFRSAYEPLARIHMLCCRMNIRIRGLAEQDTWLSSMCICLHAAQNVLATYLQLYQPALLALMTRSNDEPTPSGNRASTQVTHKLAVTWRQVTRIMTSALVIVLAHSHHELVHGEAARYIAMARLLLEYPRSRWRDGVEQAVQTLTDIAYMQEFSLEEEVEKLLPGSADNLAHSSERQRPSEGDLPALNSVIIGAMTGHGSSTAPLLNAFNIDWHITGPDITFEEQSLLDLLDTSDFAINGYDLGHQQGS